MNLKSRNSKCTVHDGIYKMKFKDLIVNVINLTAIAGSTSTNSRRSLSHGTFGVDTTFKLNVAAVPDPSAILEFNITYHDLSEGRFISVVSPPGQSPEMTYYLGTQNTGPIDGEEIVLGVPEHNIDHYFDWDGDSSLKRDSTDDEDFIPLSYHVYCDSLDKATAFYPFANPPGLMMGVNIEGPITLNKPGVLSLQNIALELETES